MTITIMTKATTIYSAIKPSSSKMSNIRKSVANIQHTRHIRSAIAAILITYDKHPLIIICFSVYELTQNFLKTIGVNYDVNFCQFGVIFCFGLIRMQRVALVSQNKKDVFATIGITKYINPPNLFRGLFKLLYEKLDKLVRQC